MTRTFRYRFVGLSEAEATALTGVPVTIVQQHNPYDIDLSYDDGDLFNSNDVIQQGLRFKLLGEVVDGEVLPVEITPPGG